MVSPIISVQSHFAVMCSEGDSETLYNMVVGLDHAGGSQLL